jgi:uncharacterized lipoprotein YajG
MYKKIFILIFSLFLFTGCASMNETGNNAYDNIAGSVSKGYNSVKNWVTGNNK